MHFAALLIAASALPVNLASSTGHRSLTDFTDEAPLLAQVAPPPTRPSIPLPPIEDQTPDLREKLLLARQAIQNLSQSLAVAREEALEASEEAEQLSLRLEALGVPGVAGDEAKVEQRLVGAVRDLRLLKEKYDSSINQLIRLTEAVQLMLTTAQGVDPEVRMSVETELRRTNELLGAGRAEEPAAAEATLADAMVIDTKEDLALIVTNAGENQGVRIGMPFQVIRDNKLIGTARVVDVREKISGAIIQSLENESVTIKSGDRLKVDAKR